MALASLASIDPPGSHAAECGAEITTISGTVDTRRSYDAKLPIPAMFGATNIAARPGAAETSDTSSPTKSPRRSCSAARSRATCASAYAASTVKATNSPSNCSTDTPDRSANGSNSISDCSTNSSNRSSDSTDSTTESADTLSVGAVLNDRSGSKSEQ